MTEIVYVVTYEYHHQYERGNGCLGVTKSPEKAVEMMHKQRDIFLLDEYNTTIEEAREDGGYTLEEDEDMFYVQLGDSEIWSEVRIIAKQMEAEPERYIEVLFNYEGVFYCEQIPLQKIDLDHYEHIWSWWFEASVGDGSPGLVFEVTADKDSDGGVGVGNMCVSVYDDDDDNEPIDMINEVGIRKSWENSKSFK